MRCARCAAEHDRDRHHPTGFMHVFEGCEDTIHDPTECHDLWHDIEDNHADIADAAIWSHIILAVALHEGAHAYAEPKVAN